MREIKFRAWHKEYKTLVPWEVLRDLFEGLKIMVTDHVIRQVDDFTGEVEINTTPWSSYKTYREINIFEHSDFEIMQYTGLKDKNGVEIYEGDVIKASYGGERRRFKVFWSSNVGSWATEEIGGWDVMEKFGSIFPQDGIKRNRVEVIGNIYENPELIEDQRGGEER